MPRLPSVVRSANGVGDQAEQHADAGGAEAPVPADRFAQRAGDDLAEEGAGVDAHVEDREAGVAPRAAFGIQIADDRRDVRLEQTRCRSR